MLQLRYPRRCRLRNRRRPRGGDGHARPGAALRVRQAPRLHRVRALRRGQWSRGSSCVRAPMRRERGALRQKRLCRHRCRFGHFFLAPSAPMALCMSSIALGARTAAPAKRSAPSGRVAAAKAAMPCKAAELRASAASAFVSAAPVRASRAVARRASARVATVTTSAFKARSGISRYDAFCCPAPRRGSVSRMPLRSRAPRDRRWWCWALPAASASRCRCC